MISQKERRRRSRATGTHTGEGTVASHPHYHSKLPHLFPELRSLLPKTAREARHYSSGNQRVDLSSGMAHFPLQRDETGGVPTSLIAVAYQSISQKSKLSSET